ncbi:MAG: lipoyl(octanoyl) transferase LipB [Deltaproteobacteria bacterium]|nr:MAG: lipoyl(octanoyl) transferase LipB [Deltaproteobacteria bacterium]
MDRELRIEWLGRVPYAEGLERQRKALEARREGSAGDVLLLLEHPPVITLGRRADRRHVLASREALAARGIELFEVARGGDVTYHGPGQLVGYPIVDLAARDARDVHAFLRGIESALVGALAALGVSARTHRGLTGVFAAQSRPGAPRRKIASIGIGVRGWVTCHGFALNVRNDLRGFRDIVPCGLHGIEMTSVAAELASQAPADLYARARRAVADAFAGLLA